MRVTRFSKPYNILDKKNYSYYVHNFRKGINKKHWAKDRDELTKILRTICVVMGDFIVERQGGLLMKRLGYFCVWKIPRKLPYKFLVKGQPLEERFNYHTNYHMYSPIFVPNRNKNIFIRYWSMDSTFDNSVRKRLKNKILAEFKYKNYLYSVHRSSRDRSI